MAFEIQVNGEPVHKEEAQVVAVSVQSARGELYRAGISTEGVINVVLETTHKGDPIRLDQLEAAQRNWQSERMQDEVAGNPPSHGSRDLTQRQILSGDNVIPGVEGAEEPEQAEYGPPDRDLAQGLDPRDSDVLTARIEAYNSSGDASKAIEDNPASDPETLDQKNEQAGPQESYESVDDRPRESPESESSPAPTQPASQPWEQSAPTQTTSETTSQTTAQTTETQTPQQQQSNDEQPPSLI